MGAGASIDAVEDLKEVYNSEKEKLTDEQRGLLMLGEEKEVERLSMRVSRISSMRLSRTS